MLKIILGTISTRILVAIFSFLIVIINAYYLGAEKVGLISLIILGISIINMFNNLVGGSLVFIIPKYGIKTAINLSYIWAIVTSSAGTLILGALHLVPEMYVFHVFVLTSLLSFCNINLAALLGLGKITTYNAATFTQSVIMLVTLLMLIMVFKQTDVTMYIYSMYLANLVLFVFSFSPLRNPYRNSLNQHWIRVLKEMLKYGVFIQIANLIQLFNYRYIYYVIEFYLGKSSLGVFDVSNKLSEGIWLTPKSLATIQYSKISNSSSNEYAKKLTLAFLKLSSIATLGFILLIICIPSNVFSQIFGSDFSDIKHIMVSLSPGIFSISISLILSHYFAGLGKYYINTIMAIIGFITLVILCGIFMPEAASLGSHHALFIAGILVSSAYTLSVIVQFILFYSYTQFTFKSLLIRKEDVRLVMSELKKLKKPKIEN